MYLICFDLDGTLLNKSSLISPFTRETLALLSKNGISYTVATGRTMLSAQNIIKGHSFDLPHIYSNGVTVWHPKEQTIRLDNLLQSGEVSNIIDTAIAHRITPFVNVIGDGTKHSQKHFIYHPPPQHKLENDLIDKYYSRSDAALLPLAALPADAAITNISMIGDADAINEIWSTLNSYESLIAYSGPAIEGPEYRWMDVHHCKANKGSAATSLKDTLGASKLMCFGDSDNDLSMFELADECYAPINAKSHIKDKATSVIGHHDEDGIARFLRERFSL